MRIEFSPDRSLYLFEPRWFESSQGACTSATKPQGRRSCFATGTRTRSFLYRHIVRASRDRFRSVANDYLGFGLSDRPEGYGYTIDEHAAVVGELVDDLSRASS
jgi:haloalkane dehalogenase